MASSKIPEDYLERVYAGVLGKLIGVYVGRPFEGWTHQRIMQELGPIRHYVHEKLDVPLLVVDDDVSGTFTFIRALEEHSATGELTAELIGKTWLNNIMERKSVIAWAGRGILTEHTAYLNLKEGIKAPESGSIRLNGKALAEQIGSQIFIDSWAMVAPGNPALAAKLAEAAASVSHDGEAIHAAKLWAAMEAEAFVSRDINHLLDIGLSQIPEDCLIAILVKTVRQWTESDKDWQKTRQRIEDKHGYDKYPGLCHIAPNHSIMISALIYGGHSFHEAMHIINTSGWDTDCNSGNIGCLVGILNGLETFEGGPDWRGPLADRAWISSANGGYSLNNAAKITFDLANIGRNLAKETPLPLPKDGAQFHFSLPGSVQGFMANNDHVKIQQGIDRQGRTGLSIQFRGTSDVMEVLTDTFEPPERNSPDYYQFMATPLIYPGQTVRAVVRAGFSVHDMISVSLRLKHYNEADGSSTVDGPLIRLSIGGQEHILTWKIPDDFDGQPISKIGLGIQSSSAGEVWLDQLSYGGSPQVILRRPAYAQKDILQQQNPAKPCSIWTRQWMHNLSTFAAILQGASFWMSQDHGEAMCTTGTREWTNYALQVPSFKIVNGSGGLAVRVQGLNRYYMMSFTADRKRVALVKARDEERTELASADWPWEVDQPHNISVQVNGSIISASVAGKRILDAQDGEYKNGGIAVIVSTGCISVDEFHVLPASSI